MIQGVGDQTGAKLTHGYERLDPARHRGRLGRGQLPKAGEAIVEHVVGGAAVENGSPPEAEVDFV